MKKVKSMFLSEPVFNIWFDVYIGVPFEETLELYDDSEYIQSCGHKQEVNGRCIYDAKNSYYFIRLEKKDWCLELFIHELVHMLHFQLENWNLWYGDSFEILAYMMQYFVKEFRKKLK